MNMNTIWHNFNAERIKPDDFIVMIEIEKGSKKKYELDKESGYLILDRILYTSTHYPANYGFVPKTLSYDGDPLDVLVLCSEKLEPRSLVRCYPIGVVMTLDSGRDDAKIIAIPFSDPNYNTYKTVDDLPKHIFDEIKHFFTVYKTLENKQSLVDEVLDADVAMTIVEKSIELYKKDFEEE